MNAVVYMCVCVCVCLFHYIILLYVQARETLAEIPEQLTSFMKTQRIHPNPPPLRQQQSFRSSGGT